MGSEASHCWLTSKFFSGSWILWVVRAILIDSMTAITIQKLYQPVPDAIAQEWRRIICAGATRREDMKVMGFKCYEAFQWIFVLYVVESWINLDRWFIKCLADRMEESKAENLVAWLIISNSISMLTWSTPSVNRWVEAEFWDILIELFHSKLHFHMNRWSYILTF